MFVTDTYRDSTTQTHTDRDSKTPFKESLVNIEKSETQVLRTLQFTLLNFQYIKLLIIISNKHEMV